LYRVLSLPCGIAFIWGNRARAMADNEQAEGAVEAVEVPAAKGKLKLIIAVAGFLVIVGGGLSTWFFFFRHAGDEVQYLKVRVVLEVKEEKQVEAIKPSMPRVTDLFQTYLRELRPSDLNGSAGLFRLKEELTRRVNAAVSPTQVNAVLFKEIVIQ
jgi:flagellar FliL protein